MKLFKILFFNIVFIFILLFILDITIAHLHWGLTKQNLNYYYNAVFKTVSVDKYLKLMLDKVPVEYSFTPEFRPDVNINSSKKPIILTGCSFTYGDGLSENETLSAKLGRKTGRPIYNRAGKGWGLSHFLFLTEFDYFYKKHSEPEYLFYIFIENHLNRINKFKIEPLYVDFQPRYKLSNSKLFLMEPTIFDRLVLVENYQNNHHHYDPTILYFYFKKANENIKKYWKNTQLVILKYPTSDDYKTCNHEIWNIIKKEGILVLDVDKLTDVDLRDDKYKVDGWHPTAEAWDNVLPSLIKELKL